MAAVEPTTTDVFVGLEDAETLLPDRWATRRDRAVDAAVICLIALLQLAWLAAFGYAAYRFVL